MRLLLRIIVGLIVVAAAVVLALPLVANTDWGKSQIAAAVGEATGRGLAIDGGRPNWRMGGGAETETAAEPAPFPAVSIGALRIEGGRLSFRSGAGESAPAEAKVPSPLDALREMLPEEAEGGEAEPEASDPLGALRDLLE